MCANFRTPSESSSPSLLSQLSLDLHAHLLPGIDDGPDSFEEAIELIASLKELGFNQLHATPHVMADIYPNKKQDILTRFQEFIETPDFKALDISLHCAAEYFIDPSFMGLLERGELLTIAQKYVLVEMSTFSPSPGIHEILFEMQTKGYIPILAHPERYIYLFKNGNAYLDLKRRGCLFQVNLLSFAGYYGIKIKKAAQKLYKEELIDFLGTDTHNMNHIKKLRKFVSHTKSREILKNYSFRNVNLLS